MKKTVILLLFLALVPAFAFGESLINVDCDDIAAKSYTGNHTNGTFQIVIQTKDGATYRKNFFAPAALIQASDFVKDLGRCEVLLLHFTTTSQPAIFDITTFQIFM